MSSLKSLREEIQRVEVLHEVMGTLEKVAGFERVRSQFFFAKIQSYEKELAEYFKGMLPVHIVTEEPSSDSRSSLLLCFGPEQGLTGAFGEEFAHYIEKEIERLEPARVILTGHKLHDAFKEMKLPDTAEFLEMPRKHSSADILEPIAKRVMAGLEKKEFTEIYLVSARYKTLGGYEIGTTHVFRLRPVVEGNSAGFDDFVFIEPSLKMLIQRYLMLTFAAKMALPWREVRLVEASLRLLETNRAKENAGETALKLRRLYARTMRGKITRSINELFTGKQAFERIKQKKKVYFEYKV